MQVFECCVFLKKVDKDFKKMEQELEINATLEPPLSPNPLVEHYDGHCYEYNMVSEGVSECCIF